MRDFQSPGRSAVRALNGIAATSHPLATLAALDILKAGGNAVDAAVAASAVLCVVEPQSTGIGGDCFALFAPNGSADIVAVNGSGRAPARATANWYLEREIERLPLYHSHAVTVPGAIDAWATLLERFGTMELGRLLGAAIGFANDGYVVHERVARDWQAASDKLARDENAARIFLPGGKAPAVGDVHRQPELAATLRTIAAEGRDGFYSGRVAEDIVAYLNSLDGLHSLEDFAGQETEVLDPISTTYRGHQVFVVPPNNPGITALLMLNILEAFSFAGLDPLSIERFHLQGEATRLAFNVRETYLGDPRQVEVPVDNLLSKDFAQVLAREVSRERAMALEAIRSPG
ncbi:MAG: gamma-glutamyltransferase, partial [Rhodospirillaceae bacterium]|nr:gamma-glutamyltransferase [Rhodospirillaceae bacterium]